MKKIIIATCSLSTVGLVALLAFGGTFKKTTALTLPHDVKIEATKTITLEPHEMPASKLKETLVAELKAYDTTKAKKDLFFLEHHRYSPKILACLLMAIKEHAKARQLLEKHEAISLDLLLALRNHEATKDAMKNLELLEGKKMRLVAQDVAAIIATLDVKPINQHAYKRDGYITYYADKKEDFSLEQQATWEAKQKNILKVLQETKPTTVLDIGGNSGWFSRLAASYGASVIATDIDESCIEYQYQTAQEGGFNVTPLIQDFKKLYNDKEAQRFQSDVVLCLALVHHLVFLNQMTLEEVIEILAKVTKKTLVLEFVSLEDTCIQRAIHKPTFFNNDKIHNSAINFLENYGYKHYNVNELLKLSKKYFSKLQILESSPQNTRTLLVLTKNEYEFNS